VTLACALPAAASVRLSVYDLRGARVATLADASLPAGTHSFRWDGRGADGGAVSPGVYLARLEAAGQAVTTRLVRLAH
jgi:flagellar hook assembly protein FlgD